MSGFRRLVHLVCTVVLLACSTSAYAAWTTTPRKILIVQLGSTPWVKLEGPSEDVNACGDGDWYGVPYTHPDRDDIVAGILTARAAQLPILVRSDGCIDGTWNSFDAISIE